MSKLPDIKRITKDDFDSQYQGLIDRLAFPLNSFMEQVRNILNKGVDFDNLAQELVTVTIQTNDVSMPISKVSFKTNLTNRIKGIMVISGQITSDNTSYVTQYPFISFTQNNSVITINNISGLDKQKTYSFLLQLIS